MATSGVKTNLFLTFEIAAKCELHTPILWADFFRSANDVYFVFLLKWVQDTIEEHAA